MSSETKKQIKDRVYAILETLFIAAFLWSAFRLGMIIHNYTKGDSIYDDSRDRFTVTSAAGDSKSSGSGSTDLSADLAALRLDIHRAARIEAAQCLPEQGFESLLRRLRLVGQDAEYRTFVAGECFQVQHLFAQRRERLQEACLGAAGRAADDAEIELAG